LIRLGAQAIIVPGMDVIDWGRHQHELHARVAPTRAAEYSVPIFRLASSGISQCVDSAGRVLAAAPAPGDGAIISSTLNLAKAGTLPLDRFLAPLAVAIDSLLIVWLAFLSIASLIKMRCEKLQSDKLLHRTLFHPLPAGEGRGEGEHIN
jgi:apolipoprotein N-acyltransferase